jgi:hypothetical protein
MYTAYVDFLSFFCFCKSLSVTRVLYASVTEGYQWRVFSVRVADKGISVTRFLCTRHWCALITDAKTVMRLFRVTDDCLEASLISFFGIVSTSMAASKIVSPRRNLGYGVKEMSSGKDCGMREGEGGRGNSRCALPGHAYIWAQVTVVCQVRKDGEEIWRTLEDEFFSLFPKNMDGEGICDTLGDALREECSFMASQLKWIILC